MNVILYIAWKYTISTVLIFECSQNLAVDKEMFEIVWKRNMDLYGSSKFADIFFIILFELFCLDTHTL